MIEVNRIYNENCLDTMRRLEDNVIDLVVTSPPYDGLRKYNGFSFDFSKVAKELYRVVKLGGVVVWVVGDATKDGSESLSSFKQAIYFTEGCGFKLHDTMIYEKETLPLSHKRYEQHFEYMFVFVKGKIKTFNGIKQKSIHFGQSKVSAKRSASLSEKGSKQGGKLGKVITINEYKLKGNIWEYETGLNGHSKDEIAFKHPAIFPEKLAADHIYSWSNEGDLVYDPFSGSGTTLKMAHIHRRNWIGSEISKEYVQLSEKRLMPYLMQQSLFNQGEKDKRSVAREVK